MKTIRWKTASGLESVTVPEKIESVCDVFVHCKNLKNVALPSSLAYIDYDFTIASRSKVLSFPKRSGFCEIRFTGAALFARSISWAFCRST